VVTVAQPGDIIVIGDGSGNNMFELDDSNDIATAAGSVTSGLPTNINNVNGSKTVVNNSLIFFISF
jgi:hypothetical protein